MRPDFNLSQRLAAETLGTMLLVTVVVGSGIMADMLSGGNHAMALLGNTLATAAILPVLIIMLSPVSGAHFNPAVTMIMALRRQITPAHTALYITAQTSGGIAGTILAHLMFGHEILSFDGPARTGTNIWLAEMVAACGLLLVILAGGRNRPDALPYLVGLYIAAGYWFTSSTCFANPAVTIARAFTDSFAGISPRNVLPFIAAQMAGALLAYSLYLWFYHPRKIKE